MGFITKDTPLRRLSKLSTPEGSRSTLAVRTADWTEVSEVGKVAPGPAMMGAKGPVDPLER